MQPEHFPVDQPSEAQPPASMPGTPAAPEPDGTSSDMSDVLSSATVPVDAGEAPASGAGARLAQTMERPHPLSPIVKGWVGIVALVVYFGRDAAEHPSNYRHLHWWMFALVGGYVLLQSVIGFIAWRTTRFVVDDTEVRIEHHFIQHRSDRIALSKIQSVDVQQPFAARLLGLAAVRIDVGSGRGHTIEYLSRSRASAMRDFLFARARGEHIRVADAEARPAASRWSDRAADHRVVVRADPGRLVLAALTSHQFILGSVVPLVAIVCVWLATGMPFGVAIGILMPFLLGGYGVVSHHVVAQWNYTLTASPVLDDRAGAGLRVSRGLTSLVSESVPADRVQALLVRQSLLWRPLGLYRVQMDVLGKSFSGGDEGEVTGGNLLVPAGTRADVDAAVHAIWPGVDLDALDWRPVSRRGRWLAPLTWSTQQWCSDADLAATRGGLLELRTTLVAHARVQSARLSQGWLERRFGVAAVELHTSRGIARFRRGLLDPHVAHDFVLDELDRCRSARRRSLSAPPDLSTLPPPDAAALMPASPDAG